MIKKRHENVLKNLAKKIAKIIILESKKKSAK